MTPIRFAQLTPEQFQFLLDEGHLNGCGGKGGWLDPPDWIFTASCYHHDFNYWVGGSEEDRLKADWQFYQAMLEDAEELPWWKRWWGKAMAWTYYKAVLWFAKPFFHYADQKRSLEDLEELMNADNSNLT